MSHIVIDARELRTSSGRYIERLLHYLQAIDQTHQYTVLLKPKDMADWRPTNPHFEAVVCPHEEFSFSEQLAFHRQLTGLKADLVHFAFPQQPILYRGKTVTTIHDLTTLRFTNPDKNVLVFKLKQQIYGRVIKRAARKADHVITGSQFVKDDVVQFAKVDPGKIAVTYEAADPIPDVPEPLTELQGKQFLLYIGRPTPHKNLDRLVQAFSALRVDHPELLLVLAGKKDTNYQRIASRIEKDSLQGVVFTDFVSEASLRWMYENCAAYVFPSLSEGFGLPGLEAMVHGAPVISSNATCLPEIYGHAAHYFDPRDTAAMRQAINDVLTDQKLRATLIKAGEKQAALYSWRRMARQTLEIYEQALTTQSV